MNYPAKVSILGKEYTIEKHTYEEDSELQGLGGYCEYMRPLIVIGDLSTNPDLKDSQEETIKEIEKCTLRHEIIHAFLNESGIGQSSLECDFSWSQNEEMVDWFAIQSPKIFEVYSKLGICN